MFSSLILRKIVGGFLSGIIAAALFIADAPALYASPVRDADPLSMHTSAVSNPGLDANDVSILDVVPAAQPSLAEVLNVPGAIAAPTGTPLQQDILGASAGGQIAINGDPFAGLNTLTIDDGKPRLHNSPDFLNPFPKAENVKEWAFSPASAGKAAHRDAGAASEFPGIAELIFDSPDSIKALRELADVKYAGANAIELNVLGLDFMLERLPDSQGTVIREGTTGAELALHRAALSADSGIAAGHGDDNDGQVTTETNLGRLVLDWVIERLTSPLGILFSMFVGVVAGIWAIASSIIGLRRRVRHQPNA